MANGKGSLDCVYCIHFLSPVEGQDHCGFHGVPLPRPDCEHSNRICCNFEPNEVYFQHNDSLFPPARRFAWFGADLKPGALYEFPYNEPSAIKKSSVMRVPDYENGTWRKPEK